MTVRRLVVVPRWSGTPGSDWYPWIVDEIANMRPRPFDPAVVAAMPEPDRPTIQAWVARVREVLGDDPDELARTVVVGHSVGCQAVLRALAGLTAGRHVDRVVCVAGWFTVDAPWSELIPWIETPFDTARCRAAAGRGVTVLLSDDDPHTADWRANGEAWRGRLGASVVDVSGAQHFNGPRYPSVLQTLLETSSPDQGAPT